jgi:cobalt/nickel transport system permease protein
MADALLSPGIGGAMWAATAATTIYCARKVQNQLDDRKIPLMGVLGAFVFAAQMINFSIPGTGSSGHLGGGLLLAILLGPHAAFLTLASVLTVQALFFAASFPALLPTHSFLKILSGIGLVPGD